MSGWVSACLALLRDLSIICRKTRRKEEVTMMMTMASSSLTATCQTTRAPWERRYEENHCRLDLSFVWSQI